MKESMLSKILMSIAAFALCTSAIIAFPRVIIANFHMCPPDEKEVEYLRGKMKEEMLNSKNEEVRKQALNDDIPFIRKPKKKK